MSAKKTEPTRQDDELLVRILDELLQRNENITARAVARLHPNIGHASTITRSPYRSDLLAHYQEKQGNIRKHLNRQTKCSKEKTAAELASKDQRIAELEKQVDLLRVSHVAMIRAVGELGGMSKWMKFFESFKEARDQLHKLNVMPNAEVAELPVFHEQTSQPRE